MKVVFTPHRGSFEESYNQRVEFDCIQRLREYLVIYQKEVLGLDSSSCQYLVEYYAYCDNLKKDRFVVLYKSFIEGRVVFNPLGFLHYE